MDTTLRLVSSLASLAAVVLCVEHFWTKLTGMLHGAALLSVRLGRASWAGWAKTHPYARVGIAGGVLTLGLRAVVVVRYQTTAWQPASLADVAWSLGAPLVAVAWSLAMWPGLMWALELPWSERLLVAILAAVMAAGSATCCPGALPTDLNVAGVRAPFAANVGGGVIAVALAMFVAVVMVAALLPSWNPRGVPPVQLDLPLTPDSNG